MKDIIFCIGLFIMLSWVKEALARVKPKKKRRSKNTGVGTFSGGGGGEEEPESAEDSLNLLKEEIHKTNNVLPTQPPSTSPSAPPSSHHSPSPPPPSSPALQPPHVYPAVPPCSQPPAHTNTQPAPPSSMSFLSLLDPPTSQNTNGNAISIPEPEMPLGTQQSPQVAGEGSSVGQENQSKNTLQAAAGDVLGPAVDKTTYPSCFMTSALTNQIGQLVTVHEDKYVLVRVMGKVVKVSLSGNPCSVPPCRLVWRAAQPVPLVELPDSTFVEIDAVVCPESKKLHAAVIWQDTKPSRCLQLLNSTYLFLDSRSVTCWPKFEDISAKKLAVLFDGAIVSAEVCDAVVFIGLAKATLADLLQQNLEDCNATVYKVLEGTGGGRVLYVCTCVWLGQKPPSSILPMVINKNMLYARESHGLYTKTKKKITLCLDVDASLCVSGGSATLQVNLDGSRRSLKGTDPLGLVPGCPEVSETTRVSVHVRMESFCRKPKNLVAFSAAMIKPPDSTGLDAILSKMSAWDLLSKPAPHCPSRSKDTLREVCKSDAAGQSDDGQQKTPTTAAQNTPTTAAQNTPTTAAQNTPTTAAQKTPTTAAQKTPTTAAQKGSVPPTPKTSGTAAQKGSVPPTPKTSGTAAQKASGKASKTSVKSASMSQLSDTRQQWDYLTCSVLAADSGVAVVTAAGKKIMVARRDLYFNEAPLKTKDNVASILKRVPNLGVIYTQSHKVHEVHGHSVDHVTLAAWVGKKPSFINSVIEQRLSALKKAAAPKVTPVPPVPLPAGVTTVIAVCMIRKIIQNSVTLVVRSKFLPGNCGTAHARLCDMYDNGTPLTETEVNVKDKVWWHCQLKINNNGKQLKVPVAWRGKKPVSQAPPKTTDSQHSRQALSTGDLTSSSSRPPVQQDGRQTPLSSPPKVLKGEVAEVLEEGGRLRGEDGRDYPFSLEVCFLYGVCLHQIESSQVLQVGMAVEFEVSERSRSRSSAEVAEAVVRRVWMEGEDASLALLPTDSMIDSWCSDNSVSSATRDALKQEAELLSPSLFPTALKMEATTTVDINC